jgi:hypothetical protein
MKIAKNNGTANRGFWKVTSEARVKVEGWPEWKRNLRVTKYSVGFESKPKTK